MLFFKVIFLRKAGSIKSKDFSLNYKKKCKFNLEKLINSKQIKKTKKIIHTFEMDKCNYYFIGGLNGRESNINKHELPPPIDNNLYYGHIIVIKTDKEKNLLNLSKKEYQSFYEKQFGGFEDLGSQDTEHESDSDDYVKIEEEDYDPNLDDKDNQVDYDKFYNKKSKKNITDDSFVIEDCESSLECKTMEDTEYESSYSGEETESDEELNKYLEEELYDSE